MRDKSASIVVIAGANGAGNDVGKLPDEPRNFTRLPNRRFDIKHVEQITGDTDKIVTGCLFDQPTEPVKPVV